MKCNLVINTEYVRIFVNNKSRWTAIGKKYFAKTNSSCRIPVEFLSGSDSSCIAASVGTVSGNTILVPTGTKDIHLTITDVKTKVCFNNSTGGRVIGFTGPSFATIGQDVQYTMEFANGYAGNMLVASNGVISGNQLTVSVSDVPSVEVGLQYVDMEHASESSVELNTTSTSTSEDFPLNYYYNYSLSQQLYTADELNSDSFSMITSLSLYSSSTVRNRKLKIYMENVDDTQFSGERAVPVSMETMVFNGNVTFTENQWTAITFDSPFNYIQGKSVLMTIVDATGIYQSSADFKVYDAGQIQTAYNYRDSNPYDPTMDNTVYYSTSKNSIKFTVLVTQKTEPVGKTMYHVVTIGDQTWLAENLREPYAGAIYYDNNETTYGRNGKNHGLLYTWSEAEAIANSIPGWHLPTLDEWRTLLTTVSDAGKNLTANYGWENTSQRTDDYGFSMLPAGYFSIPDSAFCFGDINGYCWTATTNPTASEDAYTILFDHDAGVSDDLCHQKDNTRIAVRLIKDA